MNKNTPGMSHSSRFPLCILQSIPHKATPLTASNHPSSTSQSWFRLLFILPMLSVWCDLQLPPPAGATKRRRQGLRTGLSHHRYVVDVVFHLAPSVSFSVSHTQITGVVNAIQIPLAHLAVEKLNGNFFIPNLVFTILILPCIAAAWGLGRAIRKENQTKQRLRRSFGGGMLPALNGLQSDP